MKSKVRRIAKTQNRLRRRAKNGKEEPVDVVRVHVEIRRDIYLRLLRYCERTGATIRGAVEHAIERMGR